jgi:polyphenol oxidase
MTLLPAEYFIKPDWPAPTNVKAFTTTRKGGVSQSPFDGFNLAEHVDDDPQSVKQNRQSLVQSLCLPEVPFWLNQTHSNQCVQVKANKPNCSPTNADASYTRQKNQVCVTMTADCLPILLCNKSATFIAACHAGWRGLADGAVENTVTQYQSDPSELMAWIGPAISQQYFEVGIDVKSLFCQQRSENKQYFESNKDAKFQFDFVGLAADKLSRLGVKVYQSGLCSYAEQSQFFSYRRDGQTGRMASLIWIAEQ